MSNDVSRRHFVCGGCALLAAGCGPDAPPPSVARPPAPRTTVDTGSYPAYTVDSTTEPELEYPCGQQVPTGDRRVALPLVDYPELEEVGGWVSVIVSGREIAVAHVEQDCYSAILRACTHQGVAILYRPDRVHFVCPLHGGVYAVNGEKVSGPQPTGLPVYPVAREGDTVWVQIS